MSTFTCITNGKHGNKECRITAHEALWQERMKRRNIENAPTIICLKMPYAIRIGEYLLDYPSQIDVDIVARELSQRGMEVWEKGKVEAQ